MAELADALASGASWGNSVQVRFLLSAYILKSLKTTVTTFVLRLFVLLQYGLKWHKLTPILLSKITLFKFRSKLLTKNLYLSKLLYVQFIN